MSKVFFISDLHLGHEKIALWRGFKNVEEHDEFIVSNWNKVVQKKDLVWILGDLTMNKSEPYKLLDRMNGKKKVVLGNHDNPNHVKKLLEYVQAIGGTVEYKGVILSHIPIHFNELQRFKINIHGHLHEKKLIDTRYINVSCEQVNYIPVEFKELIK